MLVALENVKLCSAEVYEEDPLCSKLLHRIGHGHVHAQAPGNISGEWVSRKCEVRPGPEFVIRNYKFYDGSKFVLKQFYYGDPDCADPIFLVEARGTYSYYHPSWVVPGATEVDYQLSYVTVMPYNQHIANVLSNRVNITCHGLVRGKWVPDRKYELFNYVETNHGGFDDGYVIVDRDCLGALDFSFHELQLARVERKKHNGRQVRLLHLGDIHTERRDRQTYRPSGYQEPLLDIKMDKCPVCERIRQSDEYYPPTLHRTSAPPLTVQGSWYSQACETRPNSVFVTRHLVFHENNATWEGYYHHFSDALCREPQFTIYARGVYHAGIESPKFPHAYHYDFKVVEAKITPKTQALINTLDKSDKPCGNKEPWQIGREETVSEVNGCPALGIVIPHVEYELLRLTYDHGKVLLNLGQRRSDGSAPYKPELRPTSFQPPLTRCENDLLMTDQAAYRVYHIKYGLTGNAAPVTSCLLLISALIVLGISL